MTTDIRCEKHVGEVYPPRCIACDTLAAEYRVYDRHKRTEPDDGIEY